MLMSEQGDMYLQNRHGRAVSDIPVEREPIC